MGEKMKINHRLLQVLFVAGAIAPFSQFAQANVFDQLSREDQEKITRGEQVSSFEVVPAEPGLDPEGNPFPAPPWPKCRVYQRIHTTPEEAVAVFADYKLQSRYVPGLQKSEISKVINKSTVEVDYTYGLPMGFGTETYTVRDQVEFLKSSKSYRISWTFVRADTTKNTEGDAVFEPLNGETLLAYYSFIVPNRWGSNLGWVIDEAKKSVKDAVTAIVNQVETEKTEQPALLKKQLEELRAIFST